MDLHLFEVEVLVGVVFVDALNAGVGLNDHEGRGEGLAEGSDFTEDALKALYASGDPTVRLYAIWQPDRNGNGIADEIPLSFVYDGWSETPASLLYGPFGIIGMASQLNVQDGKCFYAIQDERFIDAIQYIRTLWDEGLIDPEFATRTQAELFTAMDSNLVGTTMTWAERARISTTTNREAGDEDALWTCVAPIVGPHGDQMTQERAAVSSVWCISADAAAAGKVEDILRLFNWSYSDEGKMLYNYGIEGVSYDMVDGAAVLKPVMVANGFVDYRSLGCEFEPFGGEWETNAFMQCLFAGMTLEELDDASASFYNGLAVVNNDYFYAMPQTLDTEAYVEYRAELITTGVCVLRDQTIAGQMTVDDFFTQYESLKAQGLQEVIDAGTEAYALLSGSTAE